MIEFKEVSIFSHDAQMLISELNEALMGIIGNDGSRHVNFEEFSRNRAAFIVGYLDGEPLCCAGICPFDAESGEVKRVFARKNSIGAGRRLFEALDIWALKNGYSRLILECREGNPHALQFYRNNGYTVCEKFPPYIEEQDAVCFEKKLNG